jgi:hypothetical protein
MGRDVSVLTSDIFCMLSEEDGDFVVSMEDNNITDGFVDCCGDALYLYSYAAKYVGDNAPGSDKDRDKKSKS